MCKQKFNFEFGKRLKEGRISAHLTEKEAAKELGIARQTIIEYEKGHGNPSLSTLQHICCLYKISPNYLLSGETYNVSNINDSDKKKVYILLSLIIDKKLRYDGRLQKFEFNDNYLKTIFSCCYAMYLRKDSLGTLEVMEKIIDYLKKSN